MEGTYNALYSQMPDGGVLRSGLSRRGAGPVDTIGTTRVPRARSRNGNQLLAQTTTLAQAATIQSLSFYVAAASGKLILGIYDATAPMAGRALSKPRLLALPQRQAGIRPRASRPSHWPPAVIGWPSYPAAMLLARR